MKDLQGLMTGDRVDTDMEFSVIRGGTLLTLTTKLVELAVK